MKNGCGPNLGSLRKRTRSKAVQKQPKRHYLNMTDRQLIELGARELAARHGFASWKDMRQRDLEYLCERIGESSGILISLSTIKRILNGQYNRLPQVATLNALSVYLGFADWQAFKAAKGKVVNGPQPPAPSPQPSAA